MIPDDTIAEIRTRADIVKVIGQHVQLKKAGRNWKGVCPFHGEKTPSFNVNPDKGFFYCFGCHKKGDVFSFVMEYEGKSFTEAAEHLAAQSGVAIPVVEDSPALRKARGERSQMLDLNKLATQFFRETLAHPERGKPGREYLDGRGIGEATRARFALGYAPADWRALGDFLKAHQADFELATKLGLVARQARAGGYYDRFRDRLVCPVIVPGGEVVGFSARVVGNATNADGTPLAKYINSPESTVYKKGKLLFGLAQARESFTAKKRAVVVEGNFDVISLHQAGFTETVAPLGTALTPEQVEALRRLADEVVVCYDGDRAGRTATRAALEVLVAADVPVRIAAIPDGEDPDSLVAKGGTERLTALLDRAQGGIEYFAFEVWGRARANADMRSRALDDAARLLAKVANPTKRDFIVGTLATAMEVDPRVVTQATQRALRTQPAKAPEAPPPDPKRRPAPTEEIELFALLADHPDLFATADALGVFSLLTDEPLRDMYSASRQGAPLVELVSMHVTAVQAELVLSAKYAAETDPKRRLEGIVATLRHRTDKAGLAQLQARLVEAKHRGDQELARQLVSQIVSTRKQVD